MFTPPTIYVYTVRGMEVSYNYLLCDHTEIQGLAVLEKELIHKH